MMWIWQEGANQFLMMWWANFLAFPAAALIAWAIFYFTRKLTRTDRTTRLKALLDLARLEIVRSLQQIDALKKALHAEPIRYTNLTPASCVWGAVRGEVVSLGDASSELFQKAIVTLTFAHSFYYDAQWLSDKVLDINYGLPHGNIADDSGKQYLLNLIEEPMRIRLDTAHKWMIQAGDSLKEYRASLGADADAELATSRLYDLIRSSD
ncbi:MAG: hypothetical protein IH861_15140 [Chloroflexi bacterium]|nr:hypothetical protein [Chloroflexota bacterium]